jgi:hypothetical protein
MEVATVSFLLILHKKPFTILKNIPLVERAILFIGGKKSIKDTKGIFSYFKPNENAVTTNGLNPPSHPKAMNFFDQAYVGKSKL